MAQRRKHAGRTPGPAPPGSRTAAPPATTAGPPVAAAAAAASVATPPAGPLPFGACVLLGLALALLNTTLPDAVLLPAVDRLPPRHVGLAIDGLLLALGAWLVARRPRQMSRRSLLLLGAGALCGCLASAALLPALHDWLAAGLRGEGLLPYYPMVALASAFAAAPAALPLGALLAVVLGDGRRGALPALLLGAAGGFTLAPWCCDVLLGYVRTLQVTALLGASATLLLLERTPRRVSVGRLAPGGAAALLALGAALPVAFRLLDQQLDRGALLAPAVVALVCAFALPGALLPRTAAAPLLLAAAVAGLPLLFPDQAFLLPEPTRETGAELLVLALVALPLGVLLGAVLAHAQGPPRADDEPGASVALAPALLALPVPLTTVLLAPHLSPRLLTTLLAVPVVLCAARAARQHAVALVTLALVMAASYAGAGPAPPPGALLPTEVVSSPDGEAALVRDPATGRRLLALDGHAAFGRSAAQERRFALLPMLLHGGPERVLVIAPGFGETASAAWSLGIAKLHWLRPFTHPESWDEVHWPGEDPPTTGSERQFLAVPREPYDVIVLAPDPRVSRRGALLGTVEFYRLLASRLQPDGLACQWWDLADIDISDLKSVIASAGTVFPSCSLLLDHPRTRRACVGLLLSREPLAVRPAELDTLLDERPAVAADIHGIGLDGLGIACLVTADSGLLELLAPVESAVHDDRPVLDVRGALRPEGSRQRLMLGLLTLALNRRDPLAWIHVPPVRRGSATAFVHDRFRAWQHLFGGAQAVVAAQGPAGRPFDMEEPGTGPDAEAPHLLQALAPLPDDGGLVDLVLGRAAYLERNDRVEEAERWLRDALATDGGEPALHFALGALQERRGLLEDAAVHYTSVLTLRPGHPAAQEALDGLKGR